MKFITLKNVQEMALEAFGGLVVVRDEGLLESAIKRAQMANRYAGADVFEAAAYIAEGIAQGHPFVDGNKRMAWLACLTFLQGNGLEAQKHDAEQVRDVIVGLACGQISISQFAFFLRGICSRRKTT